MAEGLLTLDGQPVDLEAASQEFAAAMAAPVADVPAPPKAPPAPAEEPRKRTRGRPPKHERARVEAAPAAASPEKDAERKDGVAGLLQMGAGVCLMLDMRTPESDVSFKADAVTLTSYAEPLGQAVADTARANPRFGALVDRVVHAGPYAALMSVTLGMAAQLAANHKAIPAGLLGSVSPAELVAAAEVPDGHSEA